jgi:hypothetical protein
MESLLMVVPPEPESLAAAEDYGRGPYGISDGLLME